MGVNWCNFSIQRLREYKTQARALESIAEQIQLLEDRFTAIRSATTDGTPVHGNENQRENMLIDNITKRDELKNNYEITSRERAITEKGLECLTKEERRILDMFYVERERDYVLHLCDELFISKSELYRRKDEALKKFTRACYGIVEL